LTGQLLGRNPQLALYFEAGYNLVLCSTGPELDRVKRVKAAIARLELPKQLSESREDVLSWLNEIQTHFAIMLRQHVS
jgi:hypothetical protein